MVDTPPETIEDLIRAVDIISNQTLEELENDVENKEQFMSHPMRNVLFDLLCEIKERTPITKQEIKDIDETDDAQLIRLDNMLSAKGVSGLDQELSGADNGNEYKQKISQIRTFYNEELQKYDEQSVKFKEHLEKLLRNQAKIRPIKEEEITIMTSIVQKKFNCIEVQLKQTICEQVMHLQSRYLDARRKRKNFSKRSTEVLNDYFNAHINDPYPSEQTKEELARQCSITVAQVSNWFGNKRIRFKKTLARAQASGPPPYVSLQMPSNSSSGMPSIPPTPPGFDMSGGGGPPPGMFNAYPGMPPGMSIPPPFGFMGFGAPPGAFDMTAAYNPQFMAQYQHDMAAKPHEEEK